MLKITTLLFFSMLFFKANADDGYRLWLKYDLLKNASQKAEYKRFTNFVDNQFGESIIVNTAQKELKNGLAGMLGIALQSSSKKVGGVVLKKDLNIAKEGFKIQNIGGNIIISAQTDKGILYGVFDFLRQIQTESSIDKINIASSPKIQLRMLNHWDNVLGTIERGYAGSSLWKWYELPENIDPRYIEYARANASIGINSVVLNNVNASARFMTKEYLAKVKALADVFRPYGIQVFLSINFASPKILGKLKTSDPLDPQVRTWWNNKAKEVYSFIPDFGGFLVKANSEGEPGPQEFGRTHADGANMLAEAVKPFNGLVIWRAFVYGPDPKGDRFKEAYNANLANGIGNLTNRILKMAEDNVSAESISLSDEVSSDFENEMEVFNLHGASQIVWQHISDLDKKIQVTEPFKLIKTDKDAGEKIIIELVQELYKIALMLRPFLPTTAEKILAAIKDHKKPETPIFNRL
jgi:alpha-glucuronidase